MSVSQRRPLASVPEQEVVVCSCTPLGSEDPRTLLVVTLCGPLDRHELQPSYVLASERVPHMEWRNSRCSLLVNFKAIMDSKSGIVIRQTGHVGVGPSSLILLILSLLIWQFACHCVFFLTLTFIFLKCCMHVLLILISEVFLEPTLSVLSETPFQLPLPPSWPYASISFLHRLWREVTELTQVRSSITV